MKYLFLIIILSSSIILAKTQNIKNSQLNIKDNNDELIYTLDSVIIEEWNNFAYDIQKEKKYVYLYNEENRKEFSEEYLTYDNENNTWDESILKEYRIDEQGRIADVKSRDWFESENQYKYTTEYKFGYDIHGNLTYNSYYTFNGYYFCKQTGEYNNYNVNNQITEHKSIKYRDCGAINDGTATEYYYNENKDLTKKLTLNFWWNGGGWGYENKTEYKYNNQNNIVSITNYYSNDPWDTVWSPEGIKEEFSYYEGGLLLKNSNKYRWKSNEWVNFKKEEFEYDDNNNKTLEASYFWKINLSKWRGIEKHDYTYDINNNIESNLQSNWNNDLMIWKYQIKNEFAYNTNNLITAEIESLWNSNMVIWDYQTKIESSYNTNDTITKEMTSNWNEENEIWVFEKKYEYLYNISNYLLEKTTSNWDDTNSIWVFKIRYEYLYNSSNNLLEQTTSNWDETNSVWVYKYKHSNIYDEVQNKISDAYYIWDNTGFWQEKNKWDISYSLDIDSSQFIKPYRIEEVKDLKYILYKFTKYIFIQDDFHPKSVQTLYYSDLTNIKENEINLSNHLYPNPCLDDVYIDIESKNEDLWIEIRNLHGQLLISKKTKNKKQFSISELTSGLYTYRIIDGEFIYSGKMIKQ